MTFVPAADFPALGAALLATIACGTIGHWLVLRKEALAGDAIAHSVLPGLVAGYLVTGTRSVAASFAGAAIAGAAAIALAALVRRRTHPESGAALGIVFTTAFALGVVLLETQGARQVDLDPECVLFGSIETIFYVAPAEGSPLAGVPRPIWTLAGAALLALGFSALLWKELVLGAFDPAYASVAGRAPRAIERALLAVASATIVASFEAVGSVLVIALLACPSLIAAPWAGSAASRLTLALGAGGAIATCGYLLAARSEELLGTPGPLGSTGTIATLLAVAVPASHVLASHVLASHVLASRLPARRGRRPASSA